MRLEIVTADRREAFALLGGAEVALDQRIDLGDGLSATYRGSRVQKSPGYPALTAFEVAVPAGLGAPAAAERLWLWLKAGLPAKPQGLSVDGAEIRFKEALLKRTVIAKLGG